jgi:hypothetical protein
MFESGTVLEMTNGTYILRFFSFEGQISFVKPPHVAKTDVEECTITRALILMDAAKRKGYKVVPSTWNVKFLTNRQRDVLAKIAEHPMRKVESGVKIDTFETLINYGLINNLNRSGEFHITAAGRMFLAGITQVREAA